MKDFKIIGIERKSAGGGPLPTLLAAEAQLQDESGNICFLTLVEADGIPSFYKAEKSALSDILKGNTGKGIQVLDLGDYDDILCNRDDEWYLAYNHLVSVVTFPKDASDRIVKASAGKKLSEINIAAVL